MREKAYGNYYFASVEDHFLKSLREVLNLNKGSNSILQRKRTFSRDRTASDRLISTESVIRPFLSIIAGQKGL